MQAVLLAAGMLAVAACGRIGYDAVGVGDDGGDRDGSGGDGPLWDGPPWDGPSGDGPAGDGPPPGDGPPAASCGALLPTCGPAGDSPCCESPVVTGGTFYRSYDVGTDNAYPDRSWPATVSTFRLDRYEITVGRFRQFVNAGMGTQASPPAAGAGGRWLNRVANQGGWEASWNASLVADTPALIAARKCDATYGTWTDMPAGNENRPMSCITWYEAMAFCLWDGGFLPTEAEWNYAAAGGSEQRAYPWSSPPSSLAIDASFASYGCLGDGNAGCALTDLVPVGTKPLGDGRWGQSDLGGNVWEWTLDGDSGYPTPCHDCANLTTASGRVVRGGVFILDASVLRGAYRVLDAATARLVVIGARCGRTP